VLEKFIYLKDFQSLFYFPSHSFLYIFLCKNFWYVILLAHVIDELPSLLKIRWSQVWKHDI
jgi:hypothetical protein